MTDFWKDVADYGAWTLGPAGEIIDAVTGRPIAGKALGAVACPHGVIRLEC